MIVIIATLKNRSGKPLVWNSKFEIVSWKVKILQSYLETLTFMLPLISLTNKKAVEPKG